MTRNEMLAEVEGYQPWSNPIDLQVAHECGCVTCGSKDITFEGYQRRDSRLAFIVCNQCGDCQDF